MTPTEQDKDLRERVEAIFKNPHCESCHEDWDYDSSYRTDSCCTRFMTDSISKVVQLITADRERVALGARIDEIVGILSRNVTSGESVKTNISIPRVLTLNERYVELKAQQEEE